MAFVTTAVLKKKDRNKHVGSVHEGKKSLQCEICDYNCSQKGSTDRHDGAFTMEKKAIQIGHLWLQML